MTLSPVGALARLSTNVPKFRTARRVYQRTGLAGDAEDLDRLVALNAAYTLGYYGRLAGSLSARYRRRLRASLQVSGAGGLVRPDGRGVVIVAAHLGDFDLAVSWIAQTLGRAPVVPVAKLERPVARRAFATVRQACGFTLAPAGHASISSLVASLREGSSVVLTLDRRTGGRAVEVRFFGLRCDLPVACLTLARTAEVPIVSAATWTWGARRVLAFGEPLWPTADAGPKADAATMQRLGDELEAAIRMAPHQWHLPAAVSQLSIAAVPDLTAPRRPEKVWSGARSATQSH